MSVYDDIVQIVLANTGGEAERIATDNRQWVHGCLKQRDRIAAVAEYCAHRCAGDIIEIGCLHGGTTRYLAPIAQKYNRRIICVDPWPTKCPLTNTDYGADPFGQFKAAMQEWWDLLDIVKTESQYPGTVAFIKSRPLCFAFVDGMHTYECAKTDIATVAHCTGVICVDDVLWEPGVKRAFVEGAASLGKQAYHSELCREGWIA
jgi:hypothetical protein